MANPKGVNFDSQVLVRAHRQVLVCTYGSRNMGRSVSKKLKLLNFQTQITKIVEI